MNKAVVLSLMALLLVSGCQTSRVSESRYESGEVETKYELVDDKVDGHYQSFYKNGQVKFSRQYKENQLHGHSLLYSSDGKMISDSYYENDELISMTLYDGEGLKHSFYSYKNGKQNGTFATYYKNGSVKMAGRMLDNQLDGEVIIQNEQGIRRKKKHYVRGRLNGETSYYDNTGRMLCSVTYHDGIPSGDFLILRDGMTLAECISYK